MFLILYPPFENSTTRIAIIYSVGFAKNLYESCKCVFCFFVEYPDKYSMIPPKNYESDDRNINFEFVTLKPDSN